MNYIKLMETKRPDYFARYSGNDGQVLSVNQLGRKVFWKTRDYSTYPDKFINSDFVAPFTGVFFFNVHVYHTTRTGTYIRKSDFQTNFSDFNGEDLKCGTDLLRLEKDQGFYFFSTNDITLIDDPLKHYLLILGYKNLDD